MVLKATMSPTITPFSGVEIDSSTFDISKFKANIGNYHKTSHFQLIVTLPPILSNVRNFRNLSSTNLSTAAKNMIFDVEKVTMPGVSFATEDIRRHGYGYIERKPYSPIMETINCIVRSDGKGINYDFWQTWLKSISNYQIDLSIDEINPAGTIGNTDSSFYEMNYKNEPNSGYASTVDIVAINEESKPAIDLTLKEAYPIYIGDINYDWGDMNNIVKFPVKLTYSYWTQSRYYASLLSSSNTTTTTTTSG